MNRSARETTVDSVQISIASDQKRGRSRVAFADQLRGLAALMVVCTHYGALFWLSQPVVVELTGLPASISAPPPTTLPWANALAHGLNSLFNAGWAGVALFFLISGYVIPFSLRGRGRTGFLTARAIRLLPTFWVGLGVQVAVLIAAQHMLGGVFPRTLKDLVLNMLPGVQLLMGHPSLDGIVWTLNIEVLFYLLCATAAPFIVRRSVLVLCFPAAVAVAGAVLSLNVGWLATLQPDLKRALQGLLFAPPYLVFMFIGTVLHMAEDDRRWRPAAYWLVPLLVGVFTALVWCYPYSSSLEQVPSYVMMTLLFIIAFALRSRIPAFRLPTWLASISYPLYVVHSVSGYAVMSLAWSAGWPPLACFLMALGYSIAAAQLLHWIIEIPTMRLSSSMGRLQRS